MAEIFGYPIMGGGGTGATLTVTGVAGSTVTVSKNGKSYTRTLDSNGKAIFKGLSSGTWTVTMTDGTHTATTTVVVTAEYETTVLYMQYLYNAGQTFLEVTGEWVADENSRPGVFATDKIQMYGQNNLATTLKTSKQIDMTGFNVLEVDVNVISTVNNYSALTVVVSNQGSEVARSDTTGLGQQQVLIDVSSVNAGAVLLYVGGYDQYKSDISAILLRS